MSSPWYNEAVSLSGMTRVLNFPRSIGRITVIEEFSPVTLVSRSVGVFPLRVERKVGKKIFLVSWAGSMYLIVLLAATLCHLFYVPWLATEEDELLNGRDADDDGNDSKGGGSVPKLPQNHFIRMMNPLVVNMMAIVSRINAIWYLRRDLPKVFANISQTDEFLKPERRRLENNLRTIWIIVGLNFAIGLPSQIFSIMEVYRTNSYYLGMSIFMNNFNNLTSISAEFQFLAICFLLNVRFEAINSSLVELLDRCEIVDDLPKNNRLVSILAKSNADLLTNFRNEFTDIRLYRSLVEAKSKLADGLKADVVNTLRRGHQRLCDVLDKVSDMFQVQLLFSLGGCFLNNIFNVYFFITLNEGRSEFLGAASEAQFSFVISIINYAWLGIYYAIRFSAMAAVAAKTTETAKKAIVHISKIRRGSLDSATKDELILFFDHVTSRKIQFSAAGLFYLDVPLISSAVVTGSTFLVIMGQFPKT